jgi:hypothetical protein
VPYSDITDSENTEWPIPYLVHGSKKWEVSKTIHSTTRVKYQELPTPYSNQDMDLAPLEQNKLKNDYLNELNNKYKI